MKSQYFAGLGVIALILTTSCTDQTIQLPAAISNNAVAYHGPTETVYSFAGLKSGKDWTDVTADAMSCHLPSETCKMITPLPDGIGRLAATAQTIGDEIYVFGGYSVAEDGEETSTPEVWAFNVKTQSYSRKPDMPVPVDDTVSVSYQDRYIYLISGWHKDDNVVNVQVLDTETDTWSPASDWPGKPVFGHGGGIVDNVMVVCDGVIIVPPVSTDARRTFTDISACWRGDIDASDPTIIAWRQLPSLPGKGHYRMAATGWAEENMILFAGGSDNPYNINGIGYNGVPSEPSTHVWAYDISGDEYVLFKDKPNPSMDHRGLIQVGEDEFMTVGGMGKDQKALARLDRFKVRQ